MAQTTELRTPRRLTGAPQPETMGKPSQPNKAAKQAAAARTRFVDLLEQKLEQVFGCLQALKDNFFIDRGEAHLIEAWPASYVRIDQIPKYWLISWLLALGTFLTAAALTAIDKASEYSIRELVENLTGVRLHSKLPRECLSKQVLSVVLAERFEQFGKKHFDEAWWAKLVDLEAKQLRWNDPGVGTLQYITTDGSDFVQKMMHIGGTSAELPEEIAIKKTWPPVKTYYHVDAELQQGVLNLKLFQKCDEFSFLVDFCPYEAFEKDAAKVAERLNSVAAAAQVGTVEASPELTSTKRKRGPPSGEGAQRLCIKDGDVS